MTTTAPPRSRQQRLAALHRANSVRAARARFRRRLAAADVAEARWIAGRMLEAPPDWAASWGAWDLLMALPGFGRVKVAKIMQQVGVSQRRTIAGLTERQRRQLQEALVGPLGERAA